MIEEDRGALSSTASGASCASFDDSLVRPGTEDSATGDGLAGSHQGRTPLSVCSGGVESNVDRLFKASNVNNIPFPTRVLQRCLLWRSQQHEVRWEYRHRHRRHRTESKKWPESNWTAAWSARTNYRGVFHRGGIFSLPLRNNPIASTSTFFRLLLDNGSLRLTTFSLNTRNVPVQRKGTRRLQSKPTHSYHHHHQQHHQHRRRPHCRLLLVSAESPFIYVYDFR